MSTLKISEFTEYEFMDVEEELLSKRFSDIQLQNLRNHYMAVVRDKLAVQLNIAAADMALANAEFINSHEYLRGQLELLKLLLAEHDLASANLSVQPAKD